MKTIFENDNLKAPAVSIVLIDWSVRESVHILDYLNSQSVLRNRYQVIWIEYYDRKLEAIEKKLKDSLKNKKPIIDTWLIMEMPKDIYYHKHLMYNVGILASRGKIVTFCDSDAVVNPSFVESIIKSFEQEENIVLHMDEVRNVNKRLYPFCYPTIEEIEGKGCINMKHGRPIGLVDESDPLHLKNYGACMSALKKDLIAIGGADEHIDYLGHIAGPYEMTFRLRNYGKKEVWHSDEWLYHTWHPSQWGTGNFAGPSDGRGMSQTALNILYSRRIKPLAENRAIEFLRTGGNNDQERLFTIAVPDMNRLKQWRYEVIKRKSFTAANFRYYPSTYLKIAPIFLKGYFSQLFSLIKIIFVCVMKKPKQKNILRIEKDIQGENGFDKVRCAETILEKGKRIYWQVYSKLRFVYLNNKSSIENCWHFLYNYLIPNRINEIALLGISDVAKVMLVLAAQAGINVRGVYDYVGGFNFAGHPVLKIEKLKGYQGQVLICSSINKVERKEKLVELGIKEDNILLV